MDWWMGGLMGAPLVRLPNNPILQSSNHPFHFWLWLAIAD